MIVACPECTGPFELRDGDIAELVQLECPHCRFRMILDFAAANDRRLVEPGMRMASGYRSAAEYRRAASPAPAAPAEPRPAVTAVPVEEPAAAAKVAARTAEPAHATPTRIPAAKPPRTGETVVGPVPSQPATQPAAAATESLRPTEPARSPADLGVPEPAHTADVRVEEAARVAEPTRVPDDMPRAVEPRAPIRPAEPRAEPRPPHTPPGPRPATAPAPDSGPMAVSDVDSDSLTDLERPRTSMFMTVLLVLLVLLATAVTAVSVVRKGTPDPRPLLEDVYRQLRG